MKEYLSIFIANDLTILSEYVNSYSRINWLKNECGHKLTMTSGNIKKNIRRNGTFVCPDCKKEETKLSFEDVKENVLKATQKEYKVVSLKKDYENTRSKIDILHKTCGEITDLTYKNFSLGKRCRHCASKTTNSKASELLKRLLTQIGVDFELEKKFDNCKNPMTEQYLRFDFYIEKLNLLIEIDGEQHFIPVNRFGGEEALKTSKYRDYIKDKYADENKIRLVRVSLFDFDTQKRKKYSDVRTIIFNLLNDIALEYYKETS